MAGWQSGYAAACKAVYAGSIPASASKFCPGGGIGRHKGFKIPRRQLRAGSSPALGTKVLENFLLTYNVQMNNDEPQVNVDKNTESYEINLSDLFRVIWQRKLFIIFFTSIFALSSVFYS